MALGRPLGAKLFLEGREVPFIGATMTSTVGQASIAYIDLVPHKTINEIKPRTRVEIFVRNYMQTEAEAAGKANAFPYILAWKGDVFGYNFGKTPATRTFSISCIGHSSYWDNCLAYFFNPKQTQSAGLDKASQILAAWDVKQTGEKIIPTYLSQASYFKTKIAKVISESGKDKKNDFLDGVIAIYKDIGMVNEFFKLSEDRLRISDQIIMKSSGKLMDLLDQSEGLDWFTGQADRSSGYSTLRTVIQDLMAILFHDYTEMSFPAAVRTTSMSKGGASLNKGDGGSEKKTIGSFLFKPNLYMMPPPACNIFFPDEYSSFQYNRNFFKEPTRLIYMPELPARYGQGAAQVYLPHTFEPPSFSAYMKGKAGSKVAPEYQGLRSLEIPKTKKLAELGVAGDPDTSEYKGMNNGRKSDYNFLTNEEAMKGIWLYRESMMPATNQFRAALDTFAQKKIDFTQKVAKYLFYKRRFQDRQLQITSHLKMSVVPGFPVLVLDDSHAEHNVLAYCTSVTHRIYATEGGYTNVQLSYARLVEEQDVSSQVGTDLLIPPWFAEEIFGPETTVKSDVAGDVIKKLKVQGYPAKLSSFYASLLGDMGSTSTSNLYSGENTIVGSVKKLLSEYSERKKTGAGDVMDFIAKTTSREYIKMKDYYKFYGAETSEKNVESANWITFTGDTFTRSKSNDSIAASLRGNIIDLYVNALRGQRGFRG